MGPFLLMWFVLFVLLIASMWTVFTKAGKPGWAAIIPIYNGIVLLEIVGRPLWWVLLLFIPIVNLAIGFILSIDVAKSFGKAALYAVGLFFLPFVFYPILGLPGRGGRGLSRAGEAVRGARTR